MRCGGVVLTGGTSRRLGFDKATVRIGAETLATRAARVLGAVCSPVVEVGPGHSGLPAVREDPPGSGPLAALVAGAAAVGDGGSAQPLPVFLLGCDLVRVERPLIELLVRWAGAPTVVPLVGGEPQLVCARYGPDAVGVARGLLAAGERSLRALLAALLADDRDADLLAEEHWRSVAGVDAFADLDTPDDLARLGLQPPD